MQNVPSLIDWGVIPTDWDELDARDVFFGKSLEEVRGLLVENFDMRCLDLRYIPIVPFKYYSAAFLEYLLSEDCDDDHFGIWLDLFMGSVREMGLSWKGFEREFWGVNSSFLNLLEARVINMGGGGELLREIALARSGQM